MSRQALRKDRRGSGREWLAVEMVVAWREERAAWKGWQAGDDSTSRVSMMVDSGGGL